MASTTDIRAWAKENGHDVNARGPVNAAVVELYNEATGHTEPVTVFDPEAPRDTGESPPQVKPTGIKGRFASIAKPREPKARSARRQSLEKLGGLTWQLVGNVAGGAGLVPAARIMERQAPIAGLVFEDSLKGTAVDKLAQPLARMVGKGGDIGALLGPIVLVTMIQQKPQLFPVLRPHLEEALWSMVEVSGPYFKRLQERREKRASMLADGFDMDALIREIFAPVPGQEGRGGEAEQPAE